MISAAIKEALRPVIGELKSVRPLFGGCIANASCIDTDQGRFFIQRLDDILPLKLPASLLHGDLWSGNFMVATAGHAALIDPAVYFGHNEADLAMTAMFGGFDRAFYDAYRDVLPSEAGYAERREVYNLYHLINHLNLFGESYAGGVERILKRYA